jgi:fumarate hydratase class II
MLQTGFDAIQIGINNLYALPIGGTAVGTQLNAPDNFDKVVCQKIKHITGYNFYPAENKFASLQSKNTIVFFHSALKTLATDLYKIANDIR